ncbi:MAG: phosphatase PAP2 family protein [Candidatus Bruticola sp.]
MIANVENGDSSCKIILKKLNLLKPQQLLVGIAAGLLLFNASLFIYNFMPWLDEQLLKQIIATQRCDYLTTVYFWISWLGSGMPLTYIVILACLLLALNNKWDCFGHTVATIGLTSALNSLLKVLIMRPRPLFLGFDALVNEPYFGFPSGHTAGSSAIALSIIMAAWSSSLKTVYKIGISFCSVCYAALVAWSRLYNGVHFPSDITGAIGLTIFIGYTVALVIRITKSFS